MVALVKHEAPNWTGIILAWLSEKRKRSGSTQTEYAYGSHLRRFLEHVRRTPDRVTPDMVFTYAYGIGLSGRDPSPNTIRIRLAAVSSFYRFCQRLGVLDKNPVDQIDRPRTPQAPVRGLSTEEVRTLLQTIPSSSYSGKRDRAITLACLLTGRRRTEVVTLKGCDIQSVTGVGVLYTYRGKGGFRKMRQLPPPVVDAIERSLEPLRLCDLADDDKVFRISVQGYYMNLRRYLRKAGLPDSGVHVLRHTAARLRREAGESVEDVMRFLDHSSLAITTTYLSRMETQADVGWEKVMDLIAMEPEGGAYAG